MGDVGSTHKTYPNIATLLTLIGVKYQELGTNNQASHLWNTFSEPSPQEQTVATDWLRTVSENMLKRVSKARNIPLEQLSSMAHRLYTPHQALQQRLIDQVGTFEEFTMAHYPAHHVEDVVYRRHSQSPTLSQAETSALSALWQLVTMPNLPLMMNTNPLQ